MDAHLVASFELKVRSKKFCHWVYVSTCDDDTSLADVDRYYDSNELARVASKKGMS